MIFNIFEALFWLENMERVEKHIMDDTVFRNAIFGIVGGYAVRPYRVRCRILVKQLKYNNFAFYDAT